MACLGDAGYISGEMIRTGAIATTASLKAVEAGKAAIANAEQLRENYKKQWKVAMALLDISEEEQQHLKNVFWPRELAFLNEFADNNSYEDVLTRGRRYGGRLKSAIQNKFVPIARKVRCNSGRYSTSSNKRRVQDLFIEQAKAIANAEIAGYLMAFSEIQGLKDRDFKRRIQAVGLGRNLMQEAASLYASAAEGYASVGQILSNQVNSALEATGFNIRKAMDAFGKMSTIDDKMSTRNAKDRALYEAPSDMFPNLPDTDKLGMQENVMTGTNYDVYMKDWYQFRQGVENGLEHLYYSNPSMQRDVQQEANNSGMVGQPDLVRGGIQTFAVEFAAVIIDLNAYDNPPGFYVNRKGQIPMPGL